MAYVNMMPTKLAEKYTREKLWMQKTVFDILTEQAAKHPDRVAIKDQRGAPLAVCSVGDGTTQQGEFLEATAEAIRSRLPVLFVVEDNQYAISTRTRRSR